MSDKPHMDLVGQDGNIFGILGRASGLLRQAGQPERAKEMSSRVFACDSYAEALRIVSEYVETELSMDKRAPLKAACEPSLFQKAEVIARWEQDNHVPVEKRITSWYGDYHLYEPKYGVSEEQIERKYLEIKKGPEPVKSPTKKQKKEKRTHER